MLGNATSQCRDGLLIPALATSPRNALLYLAGLFYCFLGIAIAADIFMCSIERITSATKKVKIRRKEGKLVDDTQPDEEEYEEVKVWNPTVANLTLMALGSSAPEILLSIIEIVGNGFHSGDLGPGTIVGSAAFNLFCITAICVLAISSPQSKRIDTFSVFCVTAIFGTLAYVWLLVILVWISPDVVEIWEAFLTLFFFVLLIAVAYCVDVKIWSKRRKANLETELHDLEDKKDYLNVGERLDNTIKRYASIQSLAALQPDGQRVYGRLPVPDDETVRSMARDIARVYPSLDKDDHAKILAYRLNKKSSHDRLYYRIKAIRQMTSSSRKSDQMEREALEMVQKAETTEPDSKKIKPVIEFSARVYAVQPQDKKVNLHIVRRGDSSFPITVNYATVNGIAKKDLHFLPKSENLRFAPGEMEKTISVDLVDGAEWKPNYVFYVNLKLVQQEDDDKTKLGQCNVARARYPDETLSFMGEPHVEFVRNNYVCKENCHFVRVFVSRRGKTKTPHDLDVHYETEDISANAGSDYVGQKNGLLKFRGQEHEKYIDLEIIDDKQDEKDETFSIELLKTNDSETIIGQKKRTVVTIISDDNVLKNITNTRKLLGYYMKQMTPGQATWIEQIVNASSVNSGDVANATFKDCLLHGIAFPWKFALAFIPPASILGGWLCFFVALAVVGLITAVVGDVASIFGCMVGMKDAVTAITLVALGTSLPDTFASKIAAQSEPTADNAVGNVTGSNSVNVFLGLGLPWLVAAIYWASKGQQFVVKAGNLGFSVTVFSVFSIIFLVAFFARRSLGIFGRGELGGPQATKILSGVFFVSLWLGYVGLSIWYTSK